MTKVLLDTDKAAVIEAVSGATVTDAGTPASDDKVLIQDTSDSDNLKYVNVSDLPGGGVDVLSNVATARIIGRTTAGSGDSEQLTASAVRTLINVEDGATADQDLSGLATKANVLELDNTTSFTPDADYEPATKKYVDDNAGGTVDVLSNVATARIIGRTTAGSGDSEELTASATRTFLNVEDDADKTDTANVEAAGALMDSEVINLAQVKAFDSTDYATSAQGTTADNALQARGAVNAQTGTTYTLVIGDEYLEGVRQTNAAANTITIPPNADVAFPVGSTKIFIIQGGAGSTTIAAGAGVTLSAPASVTAAIGEINGSRVIQKVGVNEWLLV